ncbi:MAG: phosphoglycerate dehydrogenase [Bacteroidia bacterium]|mgnify:FL=1|uniref:D-3-phosphoglycerate dehydrogenase n=1 Tax=uncultured Flavobacteriia bacterium TaxID=212695 RepID=H6RIJ7_9BACT|nr:D-3-phosphoglycerate dehydrogenase [uncultured Flavobacteriia bacterium]|tara:strand:+ start:8049 stop:8972 length:924 start_codon:yes stop_codon:yes gene_type:complete
MRILVTCPPMLKQIEVYRPIFEEKNIELIAPQVIQVMTEDELIEILPTMDGWIIGDDPATERVFAAGVAGNLKAAVKWGVGVDNIDFEACKKLGIPIINTPGMFGNEVSDVAIGIMINLTRKLHDIDREVRKGNWIKPVGNSTIGKKVGIVGFGDIGLAIGRKLKAFDMEIVAYDPNASSQFNIPILNFPEDIESLDYLFLACALNKSTHHLVNKETLARLKDTAIIVNVSRGPLIDEKALIESLETGKFRGVGLDVFEEEPLSTSSPLVRFDNCFFGSHNGSNTKEAVDKTSHKAIELIFNFLGVK